MKFEVVLLDPPWRHETWSDKGKGRAPENHYLNKSTLSDEEILALPIPDLLGKNAAVICWGMWSKLLFFADVPQRWGLRYSSSAFVWAKMNKRYRNRFAIVDDPGVWAMSTGHGTRKNTEWAVCFLKGSKKRKSMAVRELVIAPRGEPSAKPERIHHDIEALYDGPYLEIFARKIRNDLAGDWTFIGNEIDGQDVRVALPKLAAAASMEEYYAAK